VLSTLSRHRWALEPAVALVVLVAWVVAALPVGAAGFAVIVALCVGIGVSRFNPPVAVVFLGVAIVLFWVSPLPLADAWLCYLGAILLLFGTSAHGTAAVRWVGFAVAILSGVSAGVRLDGVDLPVLPTSIDGALGVGSAALRLVLVCLLMTVGLVAGWLAGYILSRQRAREMRDSGSFLVWFVSSGWDASGAAQAGPERLTDDDARIVRGLSRGQLAADATIAIVYAVGCLFVATNGSRLGLVAIGFYAVAVALRRLSPVVSLGVAWIGAIAHMLTGDAANIADVAVLLVLYATAAWGDRITRWAGLTSAVLGAVVGAVYLTGQTVSVQAGQGTLVQAVELLSVHFALALGFCLLILSLAWVLGLLVRTGMRARVSRRALAESEAEQRRVRQLAFAEQERTRIARDMHDVVAHSLAVVIAQADGARYARAEDPGAVDDALSAIATTARSALADVRGILAELRHSGGDAPQPTIEDIDDLVEGMCGAGLTVTVEREGKVPILGSVQTLAAYRIVQEALTNALRHGVSGSGATLRITGDERGVVLVVANASATGDDGRSPLGHGIAGMRERAALAGGALQVQSDDGTFQVIATLPGVRARGETT